MKKVSENIAWWRRGGATRHLHAGEHDRVLEAESLGKRGLDLLWGSHFWMMKRYLSTNKGIVEEGWRGGTGASGA